MQFADAVLPFDYPSAAFLMMGLNGIFAILASVGGILYVVNVVASILYGKKTGEKAVPAAQAPPIAAAIGSYGSAASLRIPGTVVLVGIFFVAFVLYYFVNWKYLSEVWPLS